MMKRIVHEIAEEIEALRQAWPDAPQEVWDSLREELIEAAVRKCENRPRPPEARRGRTPTRYRRFTCR